MTLLSPDANVLRHLCRVGERLLQADAEIASAAARAKLIAEAQTRAVPGAQFLLPADVMAMREAARKEADTALDAAYAIHRDTALLLRAIAEECAIEAEATLRSGAGRGHLYDARHHLVLAAIKVMLACAAREREEEVEELKRQARSAAA